MAEAAPFQGYVVTVPPEWVDFNGHMHDAAYAAALSDAHEALFAALGLSAEHRRSTGGALFTVESLVRYLAECSAGEALRARTLLVHADARKLHLLTELLSGRRRVATGEAFYLHVDTGRGAVAAMPAEQEGRVQELLAEHAGLPRPAELRLGGR